MSIKYRLVLSYIGMIVIPVVLIILLNFTSSFFLLDEKEGYFESQNPGSKLAKFNKTSSEVSRKINLAALDNEEILMEESFIKSLEDDLQEFYGGIIIRKGDEIVYVSERLKKLVNIDTLPKFKEEYDRKQYVKLDEGYVVTHQWDYYLKGDKVSLFVIPNII